MRSKSKVGSQNSIRVDREKWNGERGIRYSRWGVTAVEFERELAMQCERDKVNANRARNNRAGTGEAPWMEGRQVAESVQ
jgi:hypothetical protein